MDNGPSCGQLLHFYGQPRSICCCSFVLFFSFPFSSSTQTSAPTEHTLSPAVWKQLKKSNVSCSATKKPSGLRLSRRPRISGSSVYGANARPSESCRWRDDRYATLSEKGHVKRWMDVERKRQWRISKCGGGGGVELQENRRGKMKTNSRRNAMKTD